MDEYLQANQKRWDRLTLEHKNAAFYDLEGFKAGKDRLPQPPTNPIAKQEPECVPLLKGL